jgi:hypothetical protein
VTLKTCCTDAPTAPQGHDAICKKRGHVQIKITAGNSIALRGPRENLLVLRIASPEEAGVLYDGSGANLWEKAGGGRTAANGQRCLCLSTDGAIAARGVPVAVALQPRGAVEHEPHVDTVGQHHRLDAAAFPSRSGSQDSQSALFRPRLRAFSVTARFTWSLRQVLRLLQRAPVQQEPEPYLRLVPRASPRLPAVSPLPSAGGGSP